MSDYWDRLTVEQLQGADYALRLVYTSPVIKGRALEIVEALQAGCVETANRKLEWCQPPCDGVPTNDGNCSRCGKAYPRTEGAAS